MSQLWPDLLRITLCPDHVVLERGKLIISLKGVEPRYQEQEVIPLEPRHEPALWAAPLAVLAIALDGLPERPHDASVILSNHFVHYPLVQAGTASELPDGGKVVEAELESALGDLLTQHNCRLTSLRSRIHAYAADLMEELHGEPGWVVLVEDGLACIGLVLDGEYTHFRNLCMWPASSVELLPQLDREASLAGLREPPRNLILWRRDESDEVILPFDTGWQITRLGEQPSTDMPRSAAPGQVSLAGVQA